MREIMDIGETVVLRNIEANDQQWLRKYHSRRGIIIGKDFQFPPRFVRVSFTGDNTWAEYEDLGVWRLEKVA
tara:strand:- start:21292 stop:21507 length:216 start_codon:yes stop_codon:yes gene_type:complete